MRRNTLYFIIDTVLFLAVLGLVTTGLLLKFVLPPGSGRRSQILWNLRRHDWGDVHFWLAATIILFLIAHVALHWHWVRIVVRPILTSRDRCLKKCELNPQAKTGCVVQQMVNGETFLGKQEGREKRTL